MNRRAHNWRSKQQNQQRLLNVNWRCLPRLHVSNASWEQDEKLAILQKGRDILREAHGRMKYVFIEKHQAEFSIKAMCRACSGVAAAFGIMVSAADRINASAVPPTLRQRCPRGFTRSKQRYGAPRLTDELRAQGLPLQRKTVAAITTPSGTEGQKASRKFSPVSYRAAACLCQKICWSRIFTPVANQKWAGDITYLRTDEGWLYLAVVIDLWSRCRYWLVNVARMTAQLACDALQMALWRRKGARNVIVPRTVEASTVQQIIGRN